MRKDTEQSGTKAKQGKTEGQEAERAEKKTICRKTGRKEKSKSAPRKNTKAPGQITDGQTDPGRGRYFRGVYGSAVLAVPKEKQAPKNILCVWLGQNGRQEAAQALKILHGAAF